MKNYKKIRQKPYIYGFSVMGFFAFSIGGILLLLSFLTGFSFLKLVVVLVLLAVLFIFSKYFLSNSTILSKLLDNKLPTKYTEYE